MKDNPDNEYKELDLIGQGSYAKVYKAINTQTGEICAIKKIMHVSEPITSFRNEIEILDECKCENIVRYIKSDCSPTEVSIFMEYCSGGSVKDVMRTLNCTMTHDELAVIVRDVLNGLDHLHSKQRIHRDVKAANILLTQDGIAKLGDFGVSERISKDSNKKIIGTPLWLPPEVINNDTPLGAGIDIWSLGITIIEMGDGQPPYNDINEKDAFNEIKNLSKPSPTFKEPHAWPQPFLDFVASCLEKDAKRRKNANQLLDHELVRSVTTNEPLQMLVRRIFSLKSKKVELQETLTMQSEYKLINSWNILKKYNECRKRVLRFDQLKDSEKRFRIEFEKLMDSRAKRDACIVELKAKDEKCKQEKAKLGRRRDELRHELEDIKKKNENIQRNIDHVKLEQSKIAKSEADRKSKLASLGTKAG